MYSILVELNYCKTHFYTENWQGSDKPALGFEKDTPNVMWQADFKGHYV
jgi:hypothetical protein